MHFKTLKQALNVVAGLSKPSKMPGWGYSIPASTCKTGSKLRLIENSVCSKCYAHKGMYVFKNVQDALQRRYESLSDPNWLPAMIFIIQSKYDNYKRTLDRGNEPAMDCSYFRIHDSGDILSLKHLRMWVDVARNVPDVKFWLPTRETGIVRKFVNKGYRVPENMIIRISATRIGEPPQFWVDSPERIQYSSVDYTNKDTLNCEASTRNGECGECRSCWDPEIKIVSYIEH